MSTNMKPRARSRLAILGLAAAALLSGCQQPVPKSPGAGAGGKSASLRAMEEVAIAAHKCWIASKDPDFRKYRMANELNSFSGQPRFLLVPAKNYGGLPLLVVQARGGASRVEAFGPLLSDKIGDRISGDVARWASGDSSCSAKA